MRSAIAGLRDFLLGAAFLGRQAAVSVRHNWGIALLSVILATSLWIYVTDRDSETKSGRISGAIRIEAVNVPPEQAVVSISPDAVTVRARARQDVFDDLTSDDFRATVDLSGVTEQETTVTVNVDSVVPRVDVLSVSPAQVAVRLENVTSKRVLVETDLLSPPPLGFEAGEIAVDPASATVSGPDRLVSRVDTVVAEINLSGQRTNFEQQLSLQAKDAQGGTIEGVQVEPDTVKVSVQVRQLDFTSSFIVRPTVTGSPAPGFNVASLQVDPAFVAITGSSAVLQGIDPAAGISTDDVSISGATSDVVRTVSLRLPPGATADRAQVTVRVVISPAQGTFTFSVAPELTNVPSGFNASVAQDTVQVVLAGNINDLNNIDANDIRTTVDLTSLGEGQHRVEVRVQPPAGTTVSSVEPAQVDVTLTPQ